MSTAGVRIGVVGATGQIGARVVDLLTAAGHEVTAASRASGADAVTGDGVAAALDGADVVVDVLNSPTMEPGPAVDFFTGSAKGGPEGGDVRGIQHCSTLSDPPPRLPSGANLLIL